VQELMDRIMNEAQEIVGTRLAEMTA
jgi:hypothetical protein